MRWQRFKALRLKKSIQRVSPLAAGETRKTQDQEELSTTATEESLNTEIVPARKK